MVPLCAGGTAVLPLAGQAEIIGALAADMVITQMEVEEFGISRDNSAIRPLASLSGVEVVSHVGVERVGESRRQRRSTSIGLNYEALTRPLGKKNVFPIACFRYFIATGPLERTLTSALASQPPPRFAGTLAIVADIEQRPHKNSNRVEIDMPAIGWLDLLTLSVPFHFCCCACRDFGP